MKIRKRCMDVGKYRAGPSYNGGGVVFVRFWIFFQGSKIGVPSDCLGETSIVKIMMIDDVTLRSQL